MANKLRCESFYDMSDSDEYIIFCRMVSCKLWQIKSLMEEAGITDNLTINISTTGTPTVSMYNADWLLTNNIEKCSDDMIDGNTGEVIHPINYKQYTKYIADKVVDVIAYDE